ncbi:MAG: ATP-binding protein [Nitrososphaerota archaeon]|nr:ATP-binding protein [Nitrososphaerota archaeon]
MPEPSVDPVGPLARFFIENRLNGCYSVSASPAWVNPLSRWFAGHSQRRIAESTGYQHVDEDRTTTMVDHPKQVELEESVKGLERLTSKRPIRVTVQISAEDEATAYNAANVLAGALSSHRRINGLKVRRLSCPARSGWRRSTLMLPSEAAPSFWLPQVPIGIKVAPSAEFQAPPVSDGDLLLGEVVSLSGRSGRKVKIERDQLAKHVFITGMTGSGKTTSTFSLLIQLHRLGVPFLVIEPVKSEYRSLLTCVPDLQVFTIGDEATAPFRLNIFEPPPRVKVQTHLEDLEAVWNASFVSYAPLPYVVKQVFAETYRACGWYLSEDVHGRAITFDDVQVQIAKVAKELGYERDVTMDIEAALKTRLRSLTLGGKGPLFGALSSTPLDEVLKRPTVIELKEIQNDEEKAFVAAMILMNLASFVQANGQSKKLKHFTLIEEAHRLLPNVSTEKGDPESADPRRRMVEQFGEMLSEARAYGEGLGIVEQIPTKILPDAIKNTATKVIHRVPAEDDRRVLAGAINATYEQAALFTALKPGEAVVSMESHPVPFRVEVENVISKLGVPVGEVSDEEVRTRMAGFYVKNPVPRKAPKSADGRLRDLVDSEAFREPFLEAYHAWWADGQVVPLRDLLALTAPEYAAKRQGLVNAASNILTLAIESYTTLDEKDRILFSRAFMKAVGRSIGDARGLR